MDSTNHRADYGLDAPGVVRNLYFGAAVAAVILISRVRRTIFRRSDAANTG